MQDEITFPQYRKYPHGRTYFKIISASEWEEISILGSKYTVHQFKAAILPDRNYLHDLTVDYKDNWLKIGEQEYEDIKKKAEIDRSV